MKFGNPFGGRSIFYSWFFSYCIILGLLIILSVLMYSSSRKILVDEIELAKMASLHQAVESIGSRIEGVERLDMQVSMNPRVESFMNLRSPVELSSRYTLSVLIRDFTIYRASYGYINSFYVYFHDSDTVLSSETVCNTQMFHDLYIKEDIASYREWLSILKGNSKPVFLSLKDSVAYVRSLPNTPNTPAKATLVVMMDKGWLSQAIKNIVWNEAETVVLLDRYNNVITSSGPIPQNIKYTDFEFADEGHMIHEKSIIVATIKSSTTDWRILSLMPAAAFTKRTNMLQIITMIGLFLCLVVGFVLAYVFSRRNYGYIASVTEEMAALADIDMSKGNEYHILKKAVAATLEQKSRQERELVRFSAAMKQNFVRRLVRGRFGTPEEVESALLDFGVRQLSPYWAVIAVWTKQGEALGGEGRSAGFSMNRRLISFIATNHIEKEIGNKHAGLVTERDDVILCVLNLGFVSVFEWKTELRDLAENIRRTVSTEFEVVASVGISSVVRGIESIPQAYQESNDALDYKLIKGADSIIFYEDIKENHSIYQCSIETEQQLLNVLKAGDLASVLSMLDRVLDKNIDATVSVDNLKCLVFDLYNLLLKAIGTQDTDRQREFNEMIRPLLTVLEDCDTLDSVQRTIQEVFSGLCRAMGGHRREERLAQDVRSYIMENFRNVNLNIGLISDHFNLSQGYLSKLFKESTDESLLDYIARVRVAQAKQILEAGRRSLEDIAVEVGYMNSNSLIRAFKKQEGVTPGKYRML